MLVPGVVPNVYTVIPALATNDPVRSASTPKLAAVRRKTQFIQSMIPSRLMKSVLKAPRVIDRAMLRHAARLI